MSITTQPTPTHRSRNPQTTLARRIDGLDWPGLREQLDGRGFAVTEPVLAAEECAELAGLFDTGHFRSTIDMARHRFGDGRYRYFEHPLPEPIAVLRERFYAWLAPVANLWAARLGGEPDAFPPTLEGLL